MKRFSLLIDVNAATNASHLMRLATVSNSLWLRNVLGRNMNNSQNIYSLFVEWFKHSAFCGPNSLIYSIIQQYWLCVPLDGFFLPLP